MGVIASLVVKNVIKKHTTQTPANTIMVRDHPRLSWSCLSPDTRHLRGCPPIPLLAMV